MAILIVGLEGMPWSNTGATQYCEQLRLPDKGRTLKEIVVCWSVWTEKDRFFYLSYSSILNLMF